jgi:hypothetical protein
MPDPPRLSGRELFDWLQFFAFLVVVVQILRSADPLSFKLAVVGIPVAFLAGTMLLRLGGALERRRIEEHLKRKRRERRRNDGGDDLEGRRRARRYDEAA